MKPLKCFLELFKRTLGDDIATGNVTEFEECSKRSGYIGRDEPFNSIQVHLQVRAISNSST